MRNIITKEYIECQLEQPVIHKSTTEVHHPYTAESWKHNEQRFTIRALQDHGSTSLSVK